MKLVIDASSALFAAADPTGFRPFASHELTAPPLLWSEVRSALHERMWRGAISRGLAEATLRSLDAAPIRREAPDALGDEAWRVADELGWAKTYDAEYVALAHLLGCALLTSDGRLARSAARLVGVVEPSAL